MINKIKKRIISILVNYNKCIWQSSKKLKVCIQTNNYFTPKSWLDSYKKSNLFDKIEIQFANNKIDFIKLSEKANIIFCFGMSKYVQWNSSSLKLVYFGLNGIEFVKNEQFHPETLIFHPQGIARKAISEYTLCMALTLTKKFQYAYKNKYIKSWNQNEILKQKYIPFNKKEVGILGVGNVGKAIAETFKKQSCIIHAFDINPDYSLKFIDKWYNNNNLSNLLKHVDILIIALPLNNDTYHILDLSRLKLMKSESILINISRGDIIDEKALIKILQEGKIACAALDVFSVEPLPKHSKLWKLDNVIITPHIAGNINLFRDQIQEDFIKRVLTKEINNV